MVLPLEIMPANTTGIWLLNDILFHFCHVPYYTIVIYLDGIRLKFQFSYYSK